MRSLFLALAGAALLVTSASGQSLSERMNYVMQQRAKSEARNTSKAQMLGVLLYRDITLQLQDTPVREAINYLKTYLGVAIIPRYDTDRAGYGIDPETAISIDVTDQPALTVLEMILDQCAGLTADEECTWQLRNGFVEIGTKERLNSAREIRYYPIRDLLFVPPYFNNAPDLNLDAALNQGGGGFGGGGGGGGIGGGGGGGGFGGGGGGGSGGGGGGMGGGGGGSIFDDPEDEDPRIRDTEMAQEIIDIIVESIEPDAWEDNGGDAASIRYYQATLIVRAPDYIHRQIGGYPFAIRPPRPIASTVGSPRYVTFTGAISNVTNAGFRESDARQFTGSTGNGN